MNNLSTIVHFLSAVVRELIFLYFLFKEIESIKEALLLTDVVFIKKENYFLTSNDAYK